MKLQSIELTQDPLISSQCTLSPSVSSLSSYVLVNIFTSIFLIVLCFQNNYWRKKMSFVSRSVFLIGFRSTMYGYTLISQKFYFQSVLHRKTKCILKKQSVTYILLLLGTPVIRNPACNGYISRMAHPFELKFSVSS